MGICRDLVTGGMHAALISVDPLADSNLCVAQDLRTVGFFEKLIAMLP
jgi:hypothetical protein